MKTQEDYMQSWIDAENKIYEENQNILKEVKIFVSKDFFEELELYLEECDRTSSYEITQDQPREEYRQDESDYELIKEAWVNQYRNGGYEGDDYAGQVWIKITDDKYFTFHYEM